MDGIKDSGDRTQFSSGAVRDMAEGKGRLDLMPIESCVSYLTIMIRFWIVSKLIVKQTILFGF